MTSIANLKPLDDLSPAEARALTNQIKDTAQRLYALLLEAHERKAWLALGYTSWRDYAKTEFDMGQSHAYRLLDQGRVVRALEQAAGGSPIGEISEHVARQIKPHLAVVTNDITERITTGEDPTTAVVNSIDEITKRRRSYDRSRKPGDRSNRFVESLVNQVSCAIGDVPEEGDRGWHDALDFQALDRACIPQWLGELRKAARDITTFASWLEREAKR